jgi:hypothetical protein
MKLLLARQSERDFWFLLVNACYVTDHDADFAQNFQLSHRVEDVLIPCHTLVMPQRYSSQWHESSRVPTVSTTHFTTFSSNDDLLCFGTLEITDRDFGLWRKNMAVSDTPSIDCFSNYMLFGYFY